MDEIPNGFSATESGAELRLLAWMFTPEEAHLASVMTLKPESTVSIANRADVDEEATLDRLNAMASKGLISVTRAEDRTAFSLRPFVVGFYEAWLPRMDEEYASLFEEYCQKISPELLGLGPSVRRVIPVGVAIQFEVEIFP